jgi:hypothetical protein
LPNPLFKIVIVPDGDSNGVSKGQALCPFQQPNYTTQLNGNSFKKRRYNFAAGQLVLHFVTNALDASTCEKFAATAKRGLVAAFEGHLAVEAWPHPLLVESFPLASLPALLSDNRHNRYKSSAVFLPALDPLRIEPGNL